MASSEAAAAGKATPGFQLDERDQLLLGRSSTAGGANLFDHPGKEETQSKKGKKDRERRRANRDARNHDRLAKLEAAAASRSGAPMDQAVELADTTPETGAAAGEL